MLCAELLAVAGNAWQQLRPLSSMLVIASRFSVAYEPSVPFDPLGGHVSLLSPASGLEQPHGFITSSMHVPYTVCHEADRAGCAGGTG